MIRAGGGERYESVAHALAALENGEMRMPNQDGYVFIHDGARPFLTEKLLEDTYAAAYAYSACVAAVPSKDTVKLADGEGYAAQTPNRDSVWMVQTPQVFEASLLKAALQAAVEGEIPITDDCSAVERLGKLVYLVEGSEENLKITTPVDLVFAEALLQAREEVR